MNSPSLFTREETRNLSHFLRHNCVLFFGSHITPFPPRMECMEGGGQPSQLRQKIRPHKKRRNFQLVFKVEKSTLLNGLFVEKAFLWHYTMMMRGEDPSPPTYCLFVSIKITLRKWWQDSSSANWNFFHPMRAATRGRGGNLTKRGVQKYDIMFLWEEHKLKHIKFWRKSQNYPRFRIQWGKCGWLLCVLVVCV